MVIKLKIDVSKIDKNKLFKGEKGTYLDCSVLLKDDGTQDQYGNDGMVVQEITKEEREAGAKGSILGNAKIMGAKKAAPVKKQETAHIPSAGDDDLPF